ncbi:hypothetical protein EDD99_5503 [Streptomyces sp. 846.5]|nr:hypothetical protein [Streptomyces sp. 846.5]TDT97373.1 hypothetical protein EDD99_5503 [Streptomyces sp. 846.5]
MPSILGPHFWTVFVLVSITGLLVAALLADLAEGFLDRLRNRREHPTLRAHDHVVPGSGR